VNDPDRRRPPDGFDDDAIFADIIAHLNDDAPEPERAVRPLARDAAPDQETIGEATDEAPDGATEGVTEEAPHESAEASAEEATREAIREPTDLPPANPQALPTPQVWRAQEVDEEYEEHFEPLPVTPLPVGDLQFWAIIAGMAGGPLLLVYLVFFNPNAGSSWILTAIALSVGGFALLVTRLPGHHDDDDDGARL
jgi:hypothetical protein